MSENIICTYCEKENLKESGTYFHIEGNILVGNAGGIVGNNDWEIHGIPDAYFCMVERCLQKFLDDTLIEYMLRQVNKQQNSQEF